MAVDYFGAGVLFATPTFDATGSAIALPSPVQFGIVQDISIEDSADMKELYGDKQYPVDIGRGKSKLMIKCKQAQFDAQLFNSVYYGQTITAGYNAVFADTSGVALTAGQTSVAITPTAPFGGTSTFVADLGVQDGNGVPYIRVSSSPTGGQYSLSGSTYVFGTQSSGNTVFISYQYSNSTSPPNGKNLIINNIPMGQTPVFSCQFYNSRKGHTYWRKFHACTATKLSMDFKNDDFSIPDFEIGAFADSNNVVQSMSFSDA